LIVSFPGLDKSNLSKLASGLPGLSIMVAELKISPSQMLFYRKIPFPQIFSGVPGVQASDLSSPDFSQVPDQGLVVQISVFDILALTLSCS